MRIAALHALSALEAPEVVDAATAVLRETDADLVAAALSALARSSDPRADAILQQYVQSVRAAERVAAVDALRSRPRAGAVPALAWAARLGDPPELQPKAIEALGGIALDGEPAAVQALLALGVEPGAREAVIAVLASLPEESVDALGAALAQPVTSVRLLAAEALGRMRDRRASAALVRALSDEDAAVREAAVNAFGRLGTPAVRDVVAAMADSDPDASVRRRAELVCHRYGWRVESPRP